MVPLTNLILCLIMLESRGDPNAKNGDCVGVLQLRPVFVQDVNRILGRDRFLLEDRESRVKSIQMARIWFRYYEKPEWTWRDYALSFKMGVHGYEEKKEKGTLTGREMDYTERLMNLIQDVEGK